MDEKVQEFKDLFAGGGWHFQADEGACSGGKGG